MDIRFQGDMSYTIDIPPEMNDIQIPKLSIQLLVENAIKFTSDNRPPYFISITGEVNDKCHTITICDNGPGFDDDVKRNLNEKIEEINTTGLLPSLEISGMGILNVYIRCKLLYNENVIFKLENSLPHGARITIGEMYE